MGIGDGGEDAAEAGPPALILRGKIGAAKKRFAIGHEEAREGPASLPADRADGGLVAGIDVGALVAVDFYGDEMFVDDFGDGGIFVALAVYDVAPVAPYRAYVEEDGFVLALGKTEGICTPFIPVDGLMRRGTQIGAGGIF